MQKKMGISVLKKHPELPLKMESFIIDAIIVEKLNFSGKISDMACAIAKVIYTKYSKQFK